ncbi:hypothetical protein BDV96DRAFT_349575 [Lophiotrema nucula]|uniref:Uncharacterized protein n=1 Tax=Lophiotrema nucula TaxID=690887 RepID=A0A6A5ZKC0_9PLEO|nr:hypothetical protein BDV96DRAFT_349575 [Lophiotrema nucula]
MLIVHAMRGRRELRVNQVVTHGLPCQSARGMSLPGMLNALLDARPPDEACLLQGSPWGSCRSKTPKMYTSRHDTVQHFVTGAEQYWAVKLCASRTAHWCLRAMLHACREVESCAKGAITRATSSAPRVGLIGRRPRPNRPCHDITIWICFCLNV